MNAYWLSTASANIAYREMPGSGPAVVYIHGLGCASSAEYEGIAASPVLAGRRAILVDLLGSGLSDRPASFSYSIEDHARSVAELLCDVVPGSINLFGHSMGGAVAIVLAEILGTKVERVALSEPNIDPGGGVFSKRVAAMSESDYVARGHFDLVEASKAQGNAVWATSLAQSAAFAVHREAVSLIKGSTPTWRRTLYGLKMPRTVIVGERSLPHLDIGDLSHHGISVTVVAEAGHSLAIENPDGLASALHRALT
ncbi:alpha/beta hydrolase [Bradyrhizobium ontarionense]|uniref:Alpha/beta hydrolase n=1 Tax=Bradyrhizobium ontarionense TaxID=2898149 RepID=A0ABY3R5I2_9BRAD|nr:alpha/beta hydrolase [Bradyrhizobium sp. A19]UFZ02264.1 alpha/beta hydrolase [Bradyrhizobium sp. A19]